MRKTVAVLAVLGLAVLAAGGSAAADSTYFWPAPDGATFSLVIVPGTLTFVFHNLDTNGDYLVQTVNLIGNPVNVPLIFNYSAAFYWLKRVGNGVFDVYADRGPGLLFIGRLFL